MLLVGDIVRIKSVPSDCTDPVEAGLECVIERARITPDGVRYWLSDYNNNNCLSTYTYDYDNWSEDHLRPTRERYTPVLPVFRIGETVIVKEDSSIYDITDIYLIHGRAVPIIGYGYRHDLTARDEDEDWFDDELIRLEDASC